MRNSHGKTVKKYSTGKNNTLRKASSWRYDDCTTKKLNSVNRKRYSSGIFLPIISYNHGITTPVIYSELAVRATLRNKADYIRTNKEGGYLLSTVVEPLSHLSSDKPLSLTRKLNTMKNPTQTPYTYLDKADELDRHLFQAKAVIDYLCVDHGETGGNFSVNTEIVGNMLWTAQTLLENAIQTASDLHEVSKAKFQGGKNA